MIKPTPHYLRPWPRGPVVNPSRMGIGGRIGGASAAGTTTAVGAAVGSLGVGRAVQIRRRQQDHIDNAFEIIADPYFTEGDYVDPWHRHEEVANY